MKHTLKAKYAADGLSAHRQRVEATQPAVVARQREAARRQEIVDRVSARFAESTRPKLNANDVFTQATLASFRRAARANMVKWMADSMSKSLFAALSASKPRYHDDQVDALSHAWTSAQVDALSKSAPAPMTFNVIRPRLTIMDDILCP